MQPCIMPPIRFALAPRICPVTRCRSRKYSVLAQKIGLKTQPGHMPLLQPHDQIIQPPSLDPFSLISLELSHIRTCLVGLLGSAHPGLTEIAEYYLLHRSKQLRSSVVLLISKATNGLGKGWQRKQWAAAHEISTKRGEELDRPLQAPDVLYECNPNMPEDTASFSSVFHLRRPASCQSTPPQPPLPTSPLEYSISSGIVSPSLLLPTQIRLAQIVEMIHVASLLHDNISASHEPETAPKEGLNNKMAILGGDFLLGRASTALSQLGADEVVELIASVLSNQVEGEMMRMGNVKTPNLGLVKGPSSLDEGWVRYLRQVYLKSASLLAKSARGAVILGGSREGEIWKDVAYAYGRNLGIAHQLIEDASAYEAGISGLRPGLATAPALFAWEEHPELELHIRRNFGAKEDLEMGLHYVSRSTGVERTRSLARVYAQKARDILHLLPENETRFGLEALTSVVVD